MGIAVALFYLLDLSIRVVVQAAATPARLLCVYDLQLKLSQQSSPSLGFNSRIAPAGVTGALNKTYTLPQSLTIGQ